MLVKLSFAAVLLAGGQLVASESQEPCATVSIMSASFMSAFPSATAVWVPAEDAQACLSSVPLQKEEDKLLIQELMLYLSWQSNQAYLANPPSGYTEDPVDIVKSIEAIYKKLDGDGYSDEYHLQYDLSMALTVAYDFHLYFLPDILSIFLFQRANWDETERFALVSVSSDGKALPELYNYFDILNSANQGWTPSPIVEINNQTANDYVNTWAKTFTYHDADARFNRLFPNQAGISHGVEVNQFILSSIPDGPTTFVTHANGTQFEYGNYAQINADFSGVDTGELVFSSFCNLGPPKPNQKVKRKPTAVARANPVATGYPEPVILHSESVVGGYYLTGQGYDDVAILSVPSFEPESENGATEFQDVVHTFLNDAVKAGKKKLVVDLRDNGGGRVFLGYDLFRQLFPTIDEWGATQFRANDAFNVAGIAMTEKLQGFTYDQAIQDFQQQTYKGELATAWQSIFNYKLPMTKDAKPFNSWPELFGPHVFNNDNFTSLQRYNFTNFFSDDFDMDISGYRTRANLLSPQPFPASNIVMLQDGACGSTCAVFAELMKAQGNVSQVVIGGTPKTGPMQGVGGSKGAQVYSFDLVHKEALDAYNFLADYQDQLNGTELGDLVFAQRPLMRSSYSANGQARSAINLRDNIREGDTTNTPLEFVYEAADCKLFYTAGMVNDVSLVWKAAVDSEWSGKGCVDGSTGDKSSISGGVKLPGAGKTSGTRGLSVRDSAAAVVVAWFIGIVMTML
ncbi:hypothetical protein K432DRAFT_434049 [Lepidopterella palustris CBS 459.81]|uniref:Tail specific protease domain-containing protein n=1 Tax=Lepidopterella palustris CBS 459.81 TaxID=1314670 RepID=A0A8E2JGX2_9PEZI|nr:hypothetical protein K432DRAFT_434049 [Lepidopterella palustris CBS 459.81]